MENLYEVLQVSEKASKEVIEKSYKTLVKKYHPDIAKNKAKAEEIMKTINNAYEILGDEEKRKEYDEKLNNERLSKQPKMENTDQSSKMQSKSSNEYINRDFYNYKNKQYNSNIYYNNDYNNYYDYINNPNIIKRFSNLNSESKKIIIGIIIILFGVLIKLIYDVFSMFNGVLNVNEINTNVSNNASAFSASQNVNQVYLKDEELNQVFINFLNDIKKFNIEKLNNYLSTSTQLTDKQIQNIKDDKNLINKIINNMNINMYNPRSNKNDSGLMNIEINRVDIDMVLLEVSKHVFTNYNIDYSDKMIDNLILEYFDKNIKSKVTIGDEISFIKENGKWKIKLTDSNIYNMFGYNIKSGI